VHAAPAPRDRERIAVVDLGPVSPDIEHRLDAAVIAAGFEPVIGGGVEQALRGRDVERDAIELAAAIGAAERAFGALACSEVSAAAHQAIGLAAARQAAGRAVPELARAWTYLLLCADREARFDDAATAAARLRTLGGSPDVPATVWAKYPAVDAIANLELVELEVTTEVPGASVWIDFQRAGASPLRVALPIGDHVIGAAVGTQRGWAAGTAVRSQTQLQVPLREVTGAWSDVALRVSGWNGAVPPASELAWLLGRVDARIALVRRGNSVEAWGRPGRTELPRRLGDPSAAAPIEEIGRVLGVVVDRLRAWSAHAPDPDQPLLVDSPEDRAGRRDAGERPTKWWVYAAIAGAAAIGGVIIYAHDSATDRQRVELKYP
jgi:hypothetical protein